MNKKIELIAIIVGLGAVVAAGFYFYNQQNLDKVAEIENVPFSVDKKELNTTQVPSGFPADFPVEPGSRIVKNYEATTSDGRLQSTRSLTTNKTLEQAAQSYADYFIDLGWTEVESQNPDSNTSNSLLRRKDNILLIVARNNPATKEKTVEVTLTEAAK